ncbi:DUF4041 domain-containing protein [Sorangium sp. So ce834]|uniref:DUF4041 domain-containing protein n=1 Tax=Sorangium sp. So ce834 TaxID=3133321 RepID=UPI003F5E1941
MELVLIVLFVVALATAAFFASKEHKTSGSLRQAAGSLRQMESSLQQVNGELKRALDTNGGLCQHVASLQEQLQRLSRYQTIVDAEAAAAGIRAQTETWAAQLRAHAQAAATEVAAGARREADRLLADARATHAQAQTAADALKAQVSAEAQAAQAAARASVVDAEAAAAGIRAQTETWAAQLRAHAQAAATEVAAGARREADRLLADARATHAQAHTAADALKAQVSAEAQAAQAAARASVQATLAQASADAARIVDSANRRAEEIAGAALTAQREAKRLEQTAQAMKNVIEGYGDRYVMPTAGLLDELAEEFGFAEAGQRLKAARGKCRDMISDGLAATCEYAEANRRTTAIAFVLDAFNGKVDTILADVRHDNFGTLQQKIRDAFMLVNQGGRAFREARILPEYLDARLEELRWAVVAQELKVKEREEQRQIKERIREEERAQREFEKAKKEAEKEEETIRKAMEKARRDVEKANDEERVRYEQKLLELSERLRAAEEKNQRAISMAQQTKAGHVYIISNVGSFGEHVYKIGMTRRLEPLDRVRELGDASVPFEFDVHAMISSQDAPSLERVLHQRFVRNQVNKVNPRKEFFRVPLHDIRQEIERMSLEVTWTLAAEAREFRETQAIERAMASKTFDEAAWLEAQAKAEAAPTFERDLAEATA